MLTRLTVRPLAWIVLLGFLAGCGDRIPNGELEKYGRAVNQQNLGNYEEALGLYRSLEGETKHRRMRGKVALGIAQIETALARRDEALDRLDTILEEATERPISAIEEDIEEIVFEFRGTAFQAEIDDRAVAAKEEAKRRQRENRNVEREVIQSLLGKGEYAGALGYLRKREGLRPGNLRSDIPDLLAMIDVESQRAAKELLGKLSAMTGNVARQLDQLEAEMPRFRGTRAQAQLTKFRLELEAKQDSTTSTASSKSV